MQKQVKKKRRSSAYNPNDINCYIFVMGGKEKFTQLLPTDKIEEYGPEKVLVRDGELVAKLVEHGLWLKLNQYRVEENKERNRTEVWMRIS